MQRSHTGSGSPQLAVQTDPNKSPSFPHASGKNPGETRPGFPIKTFGGDAFWDKFSWLCSDTPQRAMGSFMPI